MEKNGNLGNLELIRKINRTLILNMVKEKQPISRAQISKALNLSKTTVSAIVDELIKKKLLVEWGCRKIIIKIDDGAALPLVMIKNPVSSL